MLEKVKRLGEEYIVVDTEEDLFKNVKDLIDDDIPAIDYNDVFYLKKFEQQLGNFCKHSI